jgi:HPt (histidine-containing phosphotransfer) domain-containing protein
MNEYLSKPIDAAQLAQVLAEWTGQPPPRTPSPARVATQGPADRVFDRAAALDRLGGDEELLAVALTAFRDNAPQVLASARAALAEGAAADLRRHLHSLAGSASMVGGAPLHLLARELEALAESGALPAVAERLGDLEALLARFVAQADGTQG